MQGACGGSGNSVTVQSGGTLAKTGGTGTSTLSGISTTVQGTMNAGGGTLVSSYVVLQGTPSLDGNVLPSGTTMSANGTATVSTNWNWTGGTLDGTGTVTVASGAQVNITGASGTTYDLAPIQVNGTLSVSRTTANNVPLYVYGTCSYDGSITVGSGGAFDLASDDPTNGNPLVQGACGGSGNSVTVQSGGTLAKTGGTGTSTLSGISTTVQGTMNAADWDDLGRQPGQSVVGHAHRGHLPGGFRIDPGGHPGLGRRDHEQRGRGAQRVRIGTVEWGVERTDFAHLEWPGRIDFRG